MKQKKKFPYSFKLSPKYTPWYQKTPEHKEVVSWLKDNIGCHCGPWFCNDAGVYHLRYEEDAMSFKLRWG